MRNMYNRTRGYIDAGAVVALGMLLLFITLFSAWLTHVIHCLSNSEWGFLIAGAILAPIAMIHGIGLWFGVF